jgi:hypothetical protein
MAITSTQTTHQVRNYAVGRFLDTGTVAAAVITTGFKPRYVLVSNVTSRDQVEYFEGMAAASAVKMVAAGTRTLITSNGITVSDTGFTIGLDTDIMVSNEQISWVAIG